MKSTWPPPPSFSCPTSHGFSSDTDFRAWLPNFGTLLVQAEPQFPPRAFSLHECPFILCGDLTHQAGNSGFLPHSRPQWTPWVKMHRCMPQALQWPAQCVYGAKFQLPGTIPGLLTISRYSFTDFLLSTTASVFFFSPVTDSSYPEMLFQCFLEELKWKHSLWSVRLRAPHISLLSIQQCLHLREQGLH